MQFLCVLKQNPLHLLVFSIFDNLEQKSICAVVDAVSCNIEKVLSINPSVDVFVFEANVHLKD